MEAQDYDSFAHALERLAERRPKHLSERLIDAYFNSLKRFPLNAILDILNKWPEEASRKGFPLESELIEYLKKLVPKRLPNFSQEGDIRRKVNELKQKNYQIVMQILSKGVCIDILNSLPSLKKNLEYEGTLSNYLTMDYSAYSTSLSKNELYKLQTETYKEILWYEFLLENPQGENLKCLY